MQVGLYLLQKTYGVQRVVSEDPDLGGLSPTLCLQLAFGNTTYLDSPIYLRDR